MSVLGFWLISSQGLISFGQILPAFTCLLLLQSPLVLLSLPQPPERPDQIPTGVISFLSPFRPGSLPDLSLSLQS